MEQSERQTIVDEEHLRLLPLFYWVSGGFLGAYSLFMVGYFIFIGAMFTTLPFDGADAPPPGFGWIFIGMGAAMFVVMAALVSLKILAGFWITKRKHRVATMVVAALTCFEFPYGTLAGVLTFIVLARSSVAALYEATNQGTLPTPHGQ